MAAPTALGGGCVGCVWTLGASEGHSGLEAAQEVLSIPQCVKRGGTFYVGSWKEGSSQGTGKVGGPGTLSPAESGTMLGGSPSATAVISGYFK